MGKITITFQGINPPPVNGYLIKYRRVGDGLYTTVTPNPKQSPVIINNLNDTYSYEGTIQADCSNGVYSTPIDFSIQACIGDNKKLVRGVCETGTRFNVSSTSLGGGQYSCNYKYLFSDGTTSAEFVELSTVNCMENG